MNTYEKPEAIVTQFDTEDILLLSSFLSLDIDGGSADFDESWLED